MEEKMVGIRQLKQNASEVMASVKKGARIIVTDRGRPVGRIIPMGQSPLDDLVEAGLMSEPTRSFAEVVTALTPATPAGVTAQEVLDEIREERV
ncbi:type II toxin-antitoxin system prevent-host-death family antitoxin [Pontimonas sp.]|jgi:prevent-host-death family protein|uniref:type II toxin-antitoxin system Phd/YefM family antitoxin n=1 Tax=Pontimonas sp. TaxID=2304492 RepID=UPI00286FD192|nr:type II toxin-antitoxin system prevent-host-death family antitoxin [Pontimonas sp.]MDR9434264.1 type II toxin-antitoxin system prevent-host-death family antitoxin [Pontimonas sp.]